MSGPPRHYQIPSPLFAGGSPALFGFPGMSLGPSTSSSSSLGLLAMFPPPGILSHPGLGLGNVQDAHYPNYFPSGLLSAADRHQFEVESLLAVRRQAFLISNGKAASGLAPTYFPKTGDTPSVITPGGHLDNASTLEALGSSMRKMSSPYIDASGIVNGVRSNDPSAQRTRGGVTEPFPEKLHRMLSEIEEAGDAGILSFYPHGRAFGIHDQDRFMNEIMPKYFRQTRLSSFQRQLNLYGFTRIASGPDVGGYYHELFLRGRPNLCTHMRRVGVPHGGDRRKIKPAVTKKEPDFYSMRPID